MQYLLNLGNNKKSSPAKGQGHQTTGAPVINPHGLIFGTVDWSVLGHGAVDCGCGCLPDIKTPDTITTPPEDSSSSSSAIPKLESKVNTGKFRRVNRNEWKTFSGNIFKTLQN